MHACMHACKMMYATNVLCLLLLVCCCLDCLVLDVVELADHLGESPSEGFTTRLGILVGSLVREIHLGSSLAGRLARRFLRCHGGKLRMQMRGKLRMQVRGL